MLLILWLVPVIGYRIIRRVAPFAKWKVTGVILGAIVSPASMGLYGLYFLGPVSAFFGMLGLPLVMVHSHPGYYIATELELVPKGTITLLRHQVILELINGVIWATIYCAIGAVLDAFGRKRIPSEKS